MISFIEYLSEAIKKIPSNFNPKIGWWLDSDPVTFYHGTHINNLEFIQKNGIVAPTEGPTAGWVSLALDPMTSRAYASMSVMGGESKTLEKTKSSFRSAGKKSKNTPMNERLVFVIQMKQKDFLKKMGAARGNMDTQRKKLIDKDLYEKHIENGGSDLDYYMLTEIRMPKKIDPKFIKGYMIK